MFDRKNLLTNSESLVRFSSKSVNLVFFVQNGQFCNFIRFSPKTNSLWPSNHCALYVMPQAPSRDLFSAIIKSEVHSMPLSVNVSTPKSKAGHTSNASCWPLDVVDFSPSNMYYIYIVLCFLVAITI